jgi:hypothetical protein
MAAPNGEYLVFIQVSGRWVEAGSLPFDRFLRERTLDLGAFMPDGEGTLRVRLAQKGGGAAHIDSAFLGGSPPVAAAAAGEGSGALNKLSRTDWDVISVGETGIELDFPAGAGSAVLKVTARIEGLVISRLPFQFPAANRSREINDKAAFYTYRLNSQRGGLDVDGSLAEVASKEPFFKEYCLPGSGHPPGFTWGWVWNDDENLYAAIDFTPDNTMDGDKDYAGVYVKTGAGVKEFRASVPETRWGSPAFTYTDRAAYQHKVYEFTIPLRELCAGGSLPDGELQLAFSAYGTAAPPPSPSGILLSQARL